MGGSRRTRLAIVAVALASAFAPLAGRLGVATAQTPPSTAVAFFNLYRQTAGVPTVTENAAYSLGDAHHAQYMLQNNQLSHSETQGNAWYTADGAKAAMNSNVTGSCGVPGTNVRNYRDAITGLMASPFHGLNMINPAMQQSGFGDVTDTSRQCPNMNYTAAVDVLSDIIDNNRGVPGGTTFPLPWPKNGASVPIGQFPGNESPDPLAFCAGFSNPVGLPVLLQTAAGGLPPQVTAFSIMDGATPL